MRESVFQKQIKNELKIRFPGCYVYKTDAQQIQGSPDLLVLYKDKWAALEVKRNQKEAEKSERGDGHPNQGYRVRQMNEMSFAAYIFPENKEEVLDGLERLFRPKE